MGYVVEENECHCSKRRERSLEERDNSAVILLDKGFPCSLHKALEDEFYVQRRLENSGDNKDSL